MNVNMKAFLRVTITVALVGALSACSTGAGDGSNSTKSPSHFKIAFIETNLGSPYNDSITKGLKKASKELGFDLTVVGPAAAGAADQVPFIENEITKGVNAILINANDPASVTPALKQAAAAGIKIFSINSDQDADVRTTGFTPVDFGIVPKDQLDLLSKVMGGEGQFAILSATTTATFQKTVVDAQLKLLKSDPAYSKLDLVKIAYGNDDPQTSATETQALITAYPNLKAIIAPTTIGFAAAAQAVESAGLGGKIQVTGLGQPNQMRAYLNSGTVEAFQLWDPILHGYVTGQFVEAILAGKITGKAGSTLDVPGSGKLTVSSSGVLYTQKTLTAFDKTNIANYNF